MTTTPTSRFLQHLPQFVTFFFALTLVNGFRLLADTFDWSTRPTFDISDPAQLLTAVSFSVTLFWIVTAWMGYSLLIERYPYTLEFGRFFFDIVRFSIMFALINFCFLVNTAARYHVFIFTLAFFHVMMAGWYGKQGSVVTSPEQRGEHWRDARQHTLQFLSYLLLGLIYYLGVAVRPDALLAEMIHYVVALVTSVVMIIWNIRRLSLFKVYAMNDMVENTSVHDDQSTNMPVVTRKS